MRPPAALSAPARAEGRPLRHEGVPLLPARQALALTAIAAFCLSLTTACSAPQPPIDPQAEREAVLAAVDRLWDAYAHQDLAALERLYAEEAVQIGTQRIEGRPAILRFLREYYKGLQIQGWGHTQSSVLLAGNLAVVSYWQEETGLADGEPYRVAGWVSDVWIRRGGAWLNLTTHFGANQAPAPEATQ